MGRGDFTQRLPCPFEPIVHSLSIHAVALSDLTLRPARKRAGKAKIMHVHYIDAYFKIITLMNLHLFFKSVHGIHKEQ